MNSKDDQIQAILVENERRKAVINAPYDPLVGDASDPNRVEITLDGTLYVPDTMLDDPFVRDLDKAGSYKQFIRTMMREVPSQAMINRLSQRFTRLRCQHDFEYWAATCVYIKPKGGGPDILFKLNRSQRRLVAALETMRREGRPIRLIMLKARQWGGSTCVQLYMAWLQLMHMTHLNSLIMAHQAGATDVILDMFRRMFEHYPDWLLHEDGTPGSDPADYEYDESDIRNKKKRKEKKLKSTGRSRSSYLIAERDCRIKLGTAQRPDASRGDDYNLIHCSEVALWPSTQTKNPEQTIRAITSGVVWEPMTMIVLESTANGTGNYFHREYEAAKRGESTFEPLFVPWYEIKHYSMELADPKAFATMLLEGKENTSADSERREPGQYLWSLWEAGATLEAINWYINERLKCTDHGDMASEYPSDDVEAFTHSGARVFNPYKIEALRAGCRMPELGGELEGDYTYGLRSLEHIRFVPSETGALAIWEKPEKPPYGRDYLNRYLVVVDVGGRSPKSDWSVIAVFDRFDMITGGRPKIVAQWRGHTEMHLLAWNAARIATYYNEALLVIESNTVETRGNRQQSDSDQTISIFQELRETDLDLYSRQVYPDTVGSQKSVRYGFHTNSSTKPLIIAGLIKAIHEGLYVERDEECLSEYSTYEKRPNGSYGAIEGAHDDILMTRAIGLHVCYTDMDDPEDCPNGQYAMPDWPACW